MTSSAPAKDIALRFLRASVEAGAHPGDMLGPHLWPGKVHMPGVLADWTTGLDFAVQQGWVEKLPGDQYRLTNDGIHGCTIVNLTGHLWG